MIRRLSNNKRRKLLAQGIRIVIKPKKMTDEDWEKRRKRNRKLRSLRKKGVIA
jgi:hypothetical protein